MWNNRVRIVNTSGIINTIAGTVTYGYSGDGGIATAAKLTLYDSKLANDQIGNLYIADTHNQVIRKVTYCSAPINISISGSDSICGGNQTTLKASGALTYTWSANAANATTDSVAITPSTTTVYSVTGVTNGCIAFQSFTVTVNPVLSITSSTNTICPGSNTTLTASGANSYTWSANAGSINTNTVTVSPGISTTYTLTGESGGCVSTQVYSVSVLALGLTGDTSICTGNGANLHASGMSTYTWTPGGSHNANISVNPSSTSTYTLSGSTSGCVLNKTITVQVSPSPTLSIAGTHTICAPASETLTASGASTYTWTNNLDTSVSYSNSVVANPTGSVTYHIYGAIGTCTSMISYQVVKNYPNVNVTGPFYTCPSHSVVLSSFGTATSYTWFPGGANTSSYTVTPSVNTTYTLIALSNGCLDTLTHIVFIDSCKDIINTVAGNGTVGYSGDGGIGSGALLNQPMGMAIDKQGNLYIADANNYCVRKLTPAKKITTIAGTGTSGYSGDGGLATSAQIKQTRAVAVDTSGNIFIADATSSVIRKVNAAGIISTYVGTGTAGYSGDGGPATSAMIKSPQSLVTDQAGNLYIGDANSTVRKVSTNGIITTIAGIDTAGYSGDGGPAIAAKLNNPGGLTFDAAGNLFISDSYNNCIRKISSSGIITTVAGGLAGYSGDGGPAISAKFSSPDHLVFDKQGNLYVCDVYNYVVRKINPSGIISTFAGNGYYGYWGDGGPTLVAALAPFGIAIDTSGTVYVSNLGKNVVREIGPCPSPPTITLSGLTSTCSGTPDTLHASGADAYFWAPANLTGSTVIVTPTGNTTYTVTGFKKGCITTNTITVNINFSPGFTLTVSGPQSNSYCSGDTITLTAAGATSYQWSANGGNVTTPVAQVHSNTQTTYTVYGKGNSCTETAYFTYSPMYLHIYPSNTHICPGTTPTVTLTANGANSYTWSANAGGSNNATVIVSPLSSTTYTVTGKSSGTCTVKDTVTIYVSPSLTLAFSPNDTICSGDTVTISASGATTYTWNTVNHTNTAVVNPLHSTYYPLTVSDGTCTFTKNIYINVYDSVHAASSGYICTGGTITLAGIGAATYTWMPGSITGNSINVSPTSSAVYSVTGSIANCVTSGTVMATVMSCPITGTCNNNNFENGNFLGWAGAIGNNFGASSPLTVSAWGVNTLGNNSSISSNSYHTIINVNIPNDTYGNFGQLDPGGGVYAVRLGGDVINLNSEGELLQQTFTVNLSNTSFSYRYALVLNDGGHMAGEQAYFKAEVLDSNGNVLPCLTYTTEASSNLTSSGFMLSALQATNFSNVYYLPWSIGTFDLSPYMGKTVTVRFTTAGCIYSGHFAYAYIDCSCGSFAINNSNQVQCVGNSTSTLSAPYGYTYLWSGPGIIGSTNTQNIVVNAPGTYSVTMTTYNGCLETFTTTVSTSSNNAPVVTISGSDTICLGQNTVLTANGANTYTWSANAGTAISNTVTLAPSTSTIYTVTGTDAQTGCSNTATVTIIVNGCVGIEEINPKDGLSVFPNPANGYLVIRSASALKKIIITDYSGQIVRHYDTNSNEQQIDVSVLSDGIYFVQVISQDSLRTQKIVVQR